MKRTLIIVLFFLFVSHLYSQENDVSVVTLDPYKVEKDTIKVVKRETFGKYIQKNFKFDPVKSVKGKIIVEFFVEKDGSLSDFKIIKDVGYGAADELIKVLKNAPTFKPAMLDGVPIKTKYTLPLTIDIRVR